MWRAGYRLLLWFAFPFVLARLWWRGRHEPGYRQNIAERFGFYRRTPARPVIWLHAVSVGETRAAEPLLRALRSRHPGCDLLITQMTATGREAAQQLFGGAVRVAWLPYDYPSAVRRFLRSFRPRLGILMETEIWFHLVGECQRSGVPLLLANARMSAKSARGYSAVAPLVRAALGSLSAVAAQTTEDAERLRSLGARDVEVTGNLKFDADPDPRSDSLAAQFRHRFGTRAVLLAASTRAGGRKRGRVRRGGPCHHRRRSDTGGPIHTSRRRAARANGKSWSRFLCGASRRHRADARDLRAIAEVTAEVNSSPASGSPLRRRLRLASPRPTSTAGRSGSCHSAPSKDRATC